MEEMNVLKLRNELSRYGVIMNFTGPFSQGIIEEIGQALRSYLETKVRSRGRTYKVFSVFIEQTQNIKSYAYSLADYRQQEEVLLSGILNIGVKDDVYSVTSGNYVRKQDVAALRERVQVIKGYSRDELVEAYKAQLRASDLETGAGLGLLDMARKSTQGMIYNFQEVNADYDFFTLSIKI